MKKSIFALCLVALLTTAHGLTPTHAESTAGNLIELKSGTWKADIKLLNLASQTVVQTSEAKLCASDQITSFDQIEKVFLNKYLEAGCSLSDREFNSLNNVTILKAKMTCGALSGPISIASGNNDIKVGVEMSGDPGNGVVVGKDMKTNFDWQHVANEC
ncbi:hypothetical protein [Erythrobacter crassostreae]|uniref:DUF3617 family protein n=1 Tax=Erythrobacter crassostreae TaxID=2828328 RepID=A0A9X1F3M5_9SPHN|nr:hypothetical protein [Erythrobacter crassostrea]MBV7258215.1 hypothetical protein [Erythrobacter crassostrea]